MTPSAPPATRSPAALLLAGPTASGKSAVALELAARLPGEIVSADSMQVFRGLDVGTAKPTAADRARVPHHLLDRVGPSESYDAARWLDEALGAVAAIAARGAVPIVCGGTGLYFRVWLRGLDAPAPASAELRRELEALSLPVLLAELEQRDPATFARVDRQNPRRVVRALEILRLTGKPIPPARPSVSEANRSAGDSGETPVYVLRRDAGDLRRRIEERVDEMFGRGLAGEVERLLGEGLGAERTAMQAIGYRQVVEHLRGERDLRATVALVKSRTWQFARRQMTWFRHQLPVVWIDVPSDESTATTTDRILREYRSVRGEVWRDA